MNIFHGVTLADFSTMRLGGPAAHLTEIHNHTELQEALAWASAQTLPVIMIGGGSNIFWRDEGFAGLVLVNKIVGYEVFEEDEQNVYVTIGAGENWDSVVARTVEAGLTGIETLSLIPGSTGATPIQNVGAYGQEIAQSLTTVEAFDVQANSLVNIPATDCGFGYRTSRFKTTDRGRFFITHITLHLSRGKLQPPFYPALQQYLTDHNVSDITPATVRQAVIAIRNSKLPDPALVANNGSFFANPIISQGQLTQIQADTSLTVPHWPTQENLVKISAAWLVEQAGFKDFHDPETGMATWAKQSLVLVNESAQSTAHLLAFKQKIVDAVQAKFGITLQQEPELLP
ncbi:MAG: UDP-N-acetylpyruvoylglucosamine reductase [Candidatus Saccharibacteria bacterium]|nr:UDP-N-acetylpyruvoylglucosamine reductase [Candidatus Saccharibacteria bacterium]